MLVKLIRVFNCMILNNIKFIFLKIFNLKKFYFSFIQLISPFVTIDIRDNGKIVFGKNCNILQGNMLGVRENGILEIGDSTFINRNCQIVCHKKIIIGKNVSIGPNVVIMDHDHKFSSNGIIKGKFKNDDIIIGDNVWIGASSIILRGTKIGSNSVIGAGSVIKKIIPENSIVIQKKDTIILKNVDDKTKE